MSTRLAAQLRAARESVLAFAHKGLAVIEVTGSDRATWLNGLVTCDVTKCDPNRPTYGLVLQRTGRIMADVVVGVDEGRERLLLAIPASLEGTLLTHMEHYLVMEQAEIRAAKERFTAWALHGPRSSPVGKTRSGFDGVGGVLDRTGLGGAFFMVPESDNRQSLAELERRVLENGGAIADETDWEPLRIERGVARFGIDFDETTYPQEASLETSAVSFDKGCYLGQEVVCMLERRGHVKRKLVSLVVDAASPPPRGTEVFSAEGAPMGVVTSSAVSSAEGRSVALAMVKRSHTEVGTQLAVGGAPATVAAPSATATAAAG